jgi:hypothetical protein
VANATKLKKFFSLEQKKKILLIGKIFVSFSGFGDFVPAQVG